MNKINIYDETTTKIDHKTGEVIETTKKRVSKRQNTSEFIMLFIEGIDLLTKSDLKSTDKNVLEQLLKYTTNNSNMLFINKEVKNIIAKDTGLAFRTVDDKIRNLVDKGIILKEGQTRFLNPVIFGRGDFQNVKKLRQHFELEYNFENETAFERNTGKFLYNEDQDLSKMKIIEATQKVDGNNIEQELIMEDREVEETINTDKEILVTKSDGKRYKVQKSKVSYTIPKTEQEYIELTEKLVKKEEQGNLDTPIMEEIKDNPKYQSKSLFNGKEFEIDLIEANNRARELELKIIEARSKELEIKVEAHKLGIK